MQAKLWHEDSPVYVNRDDGTTIRLDRVLAHLACDEATASKSVATLRQSKNPFVELILATESDSARALASRLTKRLR
jgi:hypothetical protein